MLECRTVTNEKKEGILQDISFSVEKGYKVGVVGKNGAGKTTLFHTLLGDRGYTGEILYDGKNIRENMTEWKEQVAYIGEDMHFVEHATLIRNAEIFSKLYQMWDMDCFLGKLEQFGLNRKQKVQSLSRGEKIRFQLAFARGHEAKVYLMDEVTAGMDVVFRKEFYDMLHEEMDEECTVLLSTHVESDLERHMDYVCRLEKGRLHSFLSE